MADAFERHMTINELAKLWCVSVRTLRRWFRDEPGVLKWGKETTRRGAKRNYVSLRIPESVARRVYAQRIQGNWSKAS
jgi:hypothetical protein